MSDVIKLLPDAVANQIAAGEVIQRPASVIKELVENAIDAGATLVQVVVVDAGKSCIQVIDNGKGMSETDARLSFERHATSKISVATDLFALRTMGFRGEALASIAAVAQVELRTRTANEEIGTSISIEGSRVTEQKPIACPAGANFAVRNLFFNIPARRKFLKSNQTEMSNILAEFERMALAHPAVGFTLHSGESQLLNLPAGNLHRRIKDLFGKKLDSQLIPVEVETSLARISGFVGMPAAARKKGAHQFFFANQRFMRHPYFAKAIATAFERLVPEGEQVPFFICFDVDPERIDVNIHPAKTEIKFQDEQTLWPILMAAVREALGKFNAVPTIDFDTAGRPSIPAFAQGEVPAAPPALHLIPGFNPFEDGAAARREASAPTGETLFAPADIPFQAQRPTPAQSAAWQQMYAESYAAARGGQEDFIAGGATSPLDAESDFISADEATAEVGGAGARTEALRPAAGDASTAEMLYGALPEDERAVWNAEQLTCVQYLGRYILCPAPQGLLIVEQHRAHVRILYDEYLRQEAEHKGISQGLLFPQLLQLSPALLPVMESIAERLAAVGFDLSPLGGGSYSICGIPAGAEGLDPVALVQNILSDAAAGHTAAAQLVDELVAASLARRAALPVGQALSADEMRHLVGRLQESGNPNFTPDGLPTRTYIPVERIDSLFEVRR